MIADAVRTREGLLYTVGAAVFGLLAMLLLADTVNAYRAEWETREAVEAFAQRDGTARELLRALRTARPADATVRVLLGVHEVERARDPGDLDTARTLFEEALAIEPGRTSATVGLLAVRLQQAAARSPDGRGQALEEVARLTDQLAREANEPRSPDLLYLQAALEIMRGRPEQALKALEVDAPGDLLPSRTGQAARYHNLAAARILTHSSGAVPAAVLAHMARLRATPSDEDEDASEEGAGSGLPDPRSEPANLLVAAYRSDLADPRVQPQDAEGLAARCQEIADLAAGKSRRGGPHLPPRRLAPEVMNSLGLAWYRAGRYPEAAAAFGRASALVRRKEPLYLLNEAQAAGRAGLTAPRESEQRQAMLNKAYDAYRRIAEQLRDQEARKRTLALAVTNGAALALEQGEPARARMLYETNGKYLPNEAQVARDRGALWDHCRNRSRARRWYQKAIELNHPDSALLRERIQANER